MQPNMLCQQQQLSVCLSGSVLFVFLTFPMISSPYSRKGKKARQSSNRSCALGVVAVCARENLYLDYVGTSSTNTMVGNVMFMFMLGYVMLCYANAEAPISVGIVQYALLIVVD